MSTRSAAVAAAERGWAVFPCRPGNKRPAVDRWEQRAIADPERVAAHWPGERHNVGIACGPSQLVVVDLDTAEHGRELPAEWAVGPGITDGQGVLAVLAHQDGQQLPDTYTVRTPSGGLHLYFAAGERGGELRNSAGRIGPMIDVRGRGGYVVAAGSVVGGRGYEIERDAPVALLPEWLAALARPATRPASPARLHSGPVYGRLRGVLEAVLSSKPGTRNGRLYWAACRAGEMVAASKIDRATAEDLLVQAAVDTGIRGGELEARRTVASGLRAGGAR